MKIRPYICGFKLSWTQATDYRFDFLFQFICSVIPIIATLFLWKTVFNVNSIVGGYDNVSMYTYLIFSRFLYSIIEPDFFFDVLEEIQSGALSNYIVKPINYIKFWFFKTAGSKSQELLFLVFPMILVCVVFKGNLLLNLDIINIIILLISSIFAYILYFLIFMILSLLAFWLYEISSWFYTTIYLIEFLAGVVIPLSVLPKALQNVVNYLPFKYMINFPINVMVINMSNIEKISGILFQLIWVMIFYIILKVEWHFGIKRYEANGG